MRVLASFTLIELLLAISISSFVMVGMMQGQRNVIKYMTGTRKLMVINRKVCLLFNQMERDFSSAIIPHLATEEKDVEKKEPEKKEEKEKKTPKVTPEEKEKEKEDNKFYFATVYEDEKRRIEGKQQQLLQHITFITTHPLQVYGQKVVRLVRIMYQLKLDREKGTKDKPSYQLWRKETTDLLNADFKQVEVAETKKPEHIIRSHLVADNLKELYIESVMPPQPKKDEKKGAPGDLGEEKMVASFVWGDKKETIDVLPQFVTIRLSFWDEDQKNDYFFECDVPILAYPARIEKPEAKEEKKKKEEKTNAKKARK
jgi:hypothetical protein